MNNTSLRQRNVARKITAAAAPLRLHSMRASADAGRGNHQHIEEFDEPERKQRDQRRKDHPIAVPIAEIRLPRCRLAGDRVVQTGAGVRVAGHRIGAGDSGLPRALRLVETNAERNAFGELLAAFPQQGTRRAVIGEHALVEGGVDVRDRSARAAPACRARPAIKNRSAAAAERPRSKRKAARLRDGRTLRSSLPFGPCGPLARAINFLDRQW